MPTFLVEQTKDAYLLIGSITANWAYVEMGIDQIIHLVYARYSGKAIENPRPGPFSRRIQFIKKAAHIPGLSNFKTDLVAFSDAAATVSSSRHNTIHGAILNIAPEGVIGMEVYKLSSGESTLQRTDVTLQQLIDLNDCIVNLAEQAARLANATIRHTVER